MYKSKLQEWCQQRRLPMPEYDTEKTGLDHVPRFRSSVSVNGRSFTGGGECCSAKEAQNEAAKAAFLHFATTSNAAPAVVASSASPSFPSSSSSAAMGSDHPLPLTTSTTGSFHALRCNGEVTVGGQTFEAENTSARVALMSLSGDRDEDIISMYKNLLLQLAQKEGFSAPVYETSVDGPPHIPVFSSTVLIKGEKFNGTAAKTKKQAEQNAAKVAWCALKERSRSAATDVVLLPKLSPAETSSGSTSCIQPEDCKDGISEESTSSNVSLMVSQCGQHKAAASSVDDSGSQSNDVFATDMEELPGDGLPLTQVQLKNYANTKAIGLTGAGLSSKNRLQIYAQKRRLNIPVYECVREGSLHSLRYKAKVTVDGQTFESPRSFNLLKEAENAAARVALMSLSVDGDHEDSIPMYKNLLLELSQKEGLAAPLYETSIGGPSHIPVFTSTVQIVGEKFEGTAARTKKQAEQNAAKVAWSVLDERKCTRRSTLIPNFDVNQNIKNASSCARSAATDVSLLAELSLPEVSSGSSSCIQPAGCGDGFSGERTHMETSSSIHSIVPHCPQQETAKSSVVYTGLQANNAFTGTEESVGDGSPFRPMNLESHAIVDTKGKIPSSLPHCRVQVYPSTANFVPPEGGSLLPFSDDKWVAVSFDSVKI